MSATWRLRQPMRMDGRSMVRSWMLLLRRSMMSRCLILPTRLRLVTCCSRWSSRWRYLCRWPISAPRAFCALPPIRSDAILGRMAVFSFSMRMSIRRLATVRARKNHSRVRVTSVRATRQAMLVREKSTRRSNCTVV